MGSFDDAGRKTQGFLRAVDGSFTTIDGPGATGTHAYGINSAGQTVGGFTDAGGKSHGFVTMR